MGSEKRAIEGMSWNVAATHTIRSAMMSDHSLVTQWCRTDPWWQTDTSNCRDLGGRSKGIRKLVS